jgi:hypothetical protein
MYYRITVPLVDSAVHWRRMNHLLKQPAETLQTAAERDMMPTASRQAAYKWPPLS